MNEFKELGVIDPILKSIEELGFNEPSDIQRKSIPFIMEGKDVIAGSATGSGKTLAFASGIIAHCENKKMIQSLILTPTRELAEQVKDSIKNFSKYKKLKICVVYGGVSINPQIESLKRADVVVGTPGRVLDHIERQTIDLSHVKIMVLDEADRMLDMGFIDDVNRIVSHCPKDRQTLLYSATISQDIEQISKRLLRNPVKITVSNQVDPSKLKQVYYDISSKMKFPLLVHLVKKENPGLVMIFCNSRQNVDFVAKNLKNNKINAIAIHGGFSQDKRNKTLEKFHSSEVCAMVCTDVAARGLDIPNVSHVYNYDIPKDPKQYVHRIGRTARAGKEGIAINILAPSDHENFGRVQHEYTLDIHKEERPERMDHVDIIRVVNSDRPFHATRGPQNSGSRGFSGRKSGGQGFGSRLNDGDSSSSGRFRSSPGGSGSRFGGRSGRRPNNRSTYSNRRGSKKN
ncbi:DEAD/DEAH box helicase [Candidatus Woesearchaeota archaeon]|nr:DEAD/DEAH box helicase [Candidatus Woesearchaeota archaeon]